MTDFVMMRHSHSVKILNARSYGGFTTRSDHHPVITDFQLSFWKCPSMRKSEDLCFMSYQQPAEDSYKQYQNILINQLHELSLSSLNAENMEDVWKKFVSTLHNAAESSFGKVKSTKRTVKSMSPTVVELSSRQKQLHIRLNSENDPEKRQRLASERNQILHHI